MARTSTRIWSAFALVLWPAAAEAADQAFDVTGTAAVVTDYISRSVSYSNGHAAVQGSLTWSNAGGVAGLHADGWVSSIDFGPGDPAKAELWGTIGYSKALGPLTFDAGLEYTTYPGAPRALHYAYYDAFGSVSGSLGVVAAAAAVRHAPDYSGATGPATFVDVSAQTPLVGPFTAEAGLGYAALHPAAGGSYRYWSAGVTAAWEMFTAAVRYHGSDLKTCGLPCGDRVQVSVGVAF